VDRLGGVLPEGSAFHQCFQYLVPLVLLQRGKDWVIRLGKSGC
jgi:hypothetical protein